MMGCDIHLFLEGKNKDTGEWDHIIAELDDGRNYYLFGLIAGVRKTRVIFEPKGLPKDISTKVREQSIAWGADAHSFSYLNQENLVHVLLKAIDFIREDITSKDDTELELEIITLYKIKKWLEVMSSIEDYSEKRIVFWFDN
jgi:hypothetical protein